MKKVFTRGGRSSVSLILLAVLLSSVQVSCSNPTARDPQHVLWHPRQQSNHNNGRNQLSGTGDVRKFPELGRLRGFEPDGYDVRRCWLIA